MGTESGLEIGVGKHSVCADSPASLEAGCGPEISLRMNPVVCRNAPVKFAVRIAHRRTLFGLVGTPSVDIVADATSTKLRDWSVGLSASMSDRIHLANLADQNNAFDDSES